MGRPPCPSRAPSSPQMVPDFCRQPSHLVRKKLLCGCPQHLHRPEPAILLHSVSFQGSCPWTVMGGPRQKQTPSPTLQRSPAASPRLLLLRPAASRLQPLSLRRAEAREPAPPAQGLRGAADKEAAAPPRPPGPSPRGQLRAITSPQPRSRVAAASSHRWPPGPGLLSPPLQPPDEQWQGKAPAPRFGPSAACGPAGCWWTD